MFGRALAGFVSGLVCLVVLSGLEGARLIGLEQGHLPGLTFAATVVVFLAVTAALVRLAPPFGYGMAVGLSVGLLFGLVAGDPVLAVAAPEFFAIPTSFGRGATSLSVWAALGLAIATALTRSASAADSGDRSTG